MTDNHSDHDLSLHPDHSNNLPLDRQAIFNAVKEALEAGLCVMPPKQDGSKRPYTGAWEKYQNTLPTREELRAWYKGGILTGIGYICGKVSGNMETMDFDDKEIYQAYKEAAEKAGLSDLVEKIEAGCLEGTPKGIHWPYRCDLIAGNTKLGKRPKLPEEKKDENDKTKTLIETKGEGGYIIAAPTFGSVNPAGSYKLLRGSVKTIAKITPEERTLLHDLARTFNQPEHFEKDAARFNEQAIQAGGRPGDAFNIRATWSEVLEPQGWQFVFEREGVSYWRRPGKKFGISATTNYANSDLFICFSTSTPFESERGYSKFSAYTVLNHGGDFSAAARELAAKGYGDHKNETADVEVWQEPIPLPEGLPSVQSLEPEMIPEPLRGWIMDIADRMQCPPDFTATAAVVVAGGVIGRACGIHPKRRDDWLEYSNLWGAVIGRPSLMKSPAIAEALKPIRRLAAGADDAYQVASSEYEREKMIAKAKKDELERQIKVAVKKKEDPLRLFTTSMDLIPPVYRRYMTQDGTTEKIGEILVDNPRGLLVYRDELAGWLNAMDKPGREGDRAFYLEAWNAKGSFTVDRIGRGTINIPALCLSIFGAVTPGPLAEYVIAANRDGKGDDGLLQRIQVAVYPDAPRVWKDVDRFPDTEKKDRAFKIFRILAEEELYKGIPGDTPALRFDDEAQDLFTEWRRELENHLRTDDLPPALESHFAKYRKLIPCLALIFHLIEVADGTAEGAVSARAFLQAAAWGEYLEGHAFRIYGTAISPGITVARELLKHIKTGDIRDGTTAREIRRHGWSRLTTPEEVMMGLGVLQDYEWLTIDRQKTGGRPSESIRLNPRIKKD